LSDRLPLPLPLGNEIVGKILPGRIFVLAMFDIFLYVKDYGKNARELNKSLLHVSFVVEDFFNFFLKKFVKKSSFRNL
jgi:hypothetical protein